MVIQVSIPFIAGQWSLQRLPRRKAGGQGGVSIPFIAGQWSLPRVEGDPFALLPVSIPFIAGQWSLRIEHQIGALARLRSQSPSLRGSGRFEQRAQREAAARKEVSIPFIAGQWSLRAYAH